METLGIQELILILIMLGLPAAALASIILVIVSIKRAQDRKNHQR
jgi:type III secretory pathway component EscS